MTFELKEEHIKLLQRACITWQDCEYGAPEINPKRPYGNSDVEGDIAEILGWELFEDRFGEVSMSKDQAEKAEKLHNETFAALQIILELKTFIPGIYEKTEKYGTRGWKFLRAS